MAPPDIPQWVPPEVGPPLPPDVRAEEFPFPPGGDPPPADDLPGDPNLRGRSTWLARMQATRTAFVRYGWRLLTPVQDADVLPQIAPQLLKEIASLTGGNAEMVEVIEAGFLSAGVLSTIRASLSELYTAAQPVLRGNAARIKGLLAVRTVLEFWASYGVSVNLSASTGASQGIDLAVGADGRLAPTRLPVAGTVTPGRSAGFGVTSTDSHSAAITSGNSIRYLVVYGLDLCDRFVASYAGQTVLPAGDYVDLWARGGLDADVAEGLVRMLGADWDEEKRGLFLRAQRADVENVLAYAYRTGKDRDWIDTELRHRGLVGGRDRDIVVAGFTPPLGPAAFLRQLARGLDDGAVAGHYTLDSGLVNANQPEQRNKFLGGGLGSDALTAEWRLHWDLGGIARAQQALLRLRPGDVDAGIEFTDQDFERHLAFADVPPWWVPRLKELSYRPVAFRQINQLVNQLNPPFPDIVKLWRNLGYRLEDAQTLAQAGRRQAAQLAASQGHGFTAAEVVKLLVEKAMTDEAADGWLRKLFLTEEEIATIHQRVQAEQQAQHRKERLAAIHAAYVHGGRNRLDTLTDLGAILIVGAEANYLLDTWDLQKTQRLHTLSRGDAAQLLKDGLINGQQYLNRLAALGYGEQDALDSLGILLAGLRDKQAKAIAAQTKAAQAVQAKRATALNRANSAAARAAAHLSRLRAQKVNAEEHAAFVTEQAARIQQVKDLIVDMPPGPEKKKAENALARATRTDSSSQIEAERLRLLAAEGSSGGAVGGG